MLIKLGKLGKLGFGSTSSGGGGGGGPSLIFAPNILDLSLSVGTGVAGTAIRASLGRMFDYAGLLWTKIHNSHRVDGGRLGTILTWTTDVRSTATQTTIKKISSPTAWDTGPYTAESFTGSAFLQFRASQTTMYGMLGLNTDPSTNASYLTIDYAFYTQIGGVIWIYESGTSIGTFETYTTDTVFSIEYSGTTINYKVDGVSVRTVAVAAGLQLFVDSSLYDVGFEANSIYFDSAPNKHYDTDYAAAPVHPSSTRHGQKWYDTHPPHVVGLTYANGATVNHNGHYYVTPVGGADTAAFGDTVIWTDQGLYSDIALLVEPIRTNALPASGHRSFTPWTATNTPTEVANQIGLEGFVNTARTITDGSATKYDHWLLDTTIVADTNPSIMHLYFKRTGAATSFPGISVKMQTIGRLSDWTVDTDNGVLIARTTPGNDASAFSSIEKVMLNGVEWWHVTAGVANNGTDTVLRTRVYPVVAATATGAWTATATGSCVMDWVQIETGTRSASSPLLGGETRQSETGNINWPIASNFNDPEFTVIVDVLFKDSSASFSGVQHILGESLLFENTVPGLSSSDGTSTVQKATTVTKNDVIRFAITGSVAANQMTISQKVMTTYGALWSARTILAYDGAMLMTILSLANGSLHPLKYRNYHIHNSALTVAQVNTDYS